MDYYYSSEKESSRICLVSSRQVRHHVSDCVVYEFEDVICEAEEVNPITYARSPDLSRRIYKTISKLTTSGRLANLLTPDFNTPLSLDQDYDLMFVFLRNIYEIPALRFLKNWRQKCKKVVCYLFESWDEPEWLENQKSLLEPLKEFDHIFLATHNSSIQKIAYYTNRPCSFLALAVDTIQFCPYPSFPNRSIDVASIGRRSPITHQAFQKLAETGEIFYLFDTVRNPFALDTFEHRMMHANLLKRSRYFVSYFSRIDELATKKVSQEFGSRFFEGSAAGVISIGVAPATEEFKKYFDWPDAVINLPYDTTDVADFLRDLDRQPERLAKIRYNNMVNSLRKHDWIYRWEEVLATVGLGSNSKIELRKLELERIAQFIENNAHLLQEPTPSKNASLLGSLPV